MLFQPRIHFQGKSCGVNKKLFRLGVGDDIGLFVKEIIPLSAAGIKISSLIGECRVRCFQGQKSVVMPASIAFDPVSAGADNDQTSVKPGFWSRGNRNLKSRFFAQF